MSVVVKRFSRNGKRLKTPKLTELGKFLESHRIANTPRLKREKQPNFYQFNNKKLRELYKTQCSPCVASYPECATPDSHGIIGDPEKAKRFRCPKFCNGLTIVLTEK